MALIASGCAPFSRARSIGTVPRSGVWMQVGDLTTRNTLKQDGPNRLGLCQNAIPENQMALITSGRVPFQRPCRFAWTGSARMGSVQVRTRIA